jgi:hypothetical protein
VVARNPCALSRPFVTILTRRTSNGEWERPQTPLRYLEMAPQTVSVFAGVDAVQSFVNALQRLGLVLKERELQLLLSTSFDGLANVHHFGQPVGAPLAHTALNLLDHLAPAFPEQSAELASKYLSHHSIPCR